MTYTVEVTGTRAMSADCGDSSPHMPGSTGILIQHVVPSDEVFEDRFEA